MPGHSQGSRPRRPAASQPRSSRPGSSRSRTRTDPARRAAYDVLRAVADRDAYANLLLPALLTERGLTGRDAAFATELTYGTLRGRGTYDAILAACSDRDDLDPPVRDVLRLGPPSCSRSPPASPPPPRRTALCQAKRCPAQPGQAKRCPPAPGRPVSGPAGRRTATGWPVAIRPPWSPPARRSRTRPASWPRSP